MTETYSCKNCTLRLAKECTGHVDNVPCEDFEEMLSKSSRQMLDDEQSD